jgi:N-glycosylase/DNA lyase|tara:strand:+ start:9226 stop:10119 length:894 start_codon:yes stop_codon:yes gene_type:complete
MNRNSKFIIDSDVDLQNTLDSGQSFAWEKLDHEKSILFKGFYNDYEILLEQKVDHIDVEILNNKQHENFINDFKNYLGDKPSELKNYKLLINDPVISPVINRYPGLRILKQDPWECIVGFITSSCSNLQRIKHHIKLLREINADKFPLPYEILFMGEKKLRELGFGFRAPYIINIAEALTNELIFIEELENKSYEFALNELVKVKGIGRKIADCILAYSFNKTESFPVDRHVLNGLIRWYDFPININPIKASDIARNMFGDISSHAQQYIFHRQRLASRASNWGGSHKELAISSDIN